jgi:anti-sigma28 factor (negative regulator of flagellin synthesis)
MLTKLHNSPDIDDHRINIIRTQLDEDAYVVNSRQIADKIIAIELALSKPEHRPFNGQST